MGISVKIPGFYSFLLFFYEVRVRFCGYKTCRTEGGAGNIVHSLQHFCKHLAEVKMIVSSLPAGFEGLENGNGNRVEMSLTGKRLKRFKTKE